MKSFVSKIIAAACTIICAAAVGLGLLSPSNVLADTPITAAISSFDENSITAFQVNGHAALSGSSLRLTPNQNTKAGSAFWKYRVYLGNDRPFSTHFSFNISSPGGGGADGIVFTMQTDSNTAGSAGGGIGYSGIDHSLGIEFDTWQNGEFGDPDGNHIGLLVNGSVDHGDNSPPATVVSRATLLGINGSFGNFSDGSDFYVWIDYDGTTMEVRLSRSNTRSSSSLVLSQAIDLETYLGQYAYVGFTAATGGANENHDIKTFYFNNEYAPGGLTPDTVTYTAAPYRLEASAAESAAGSGGNRTSLVTATVYDLAGNVLPNQTITFSTDNGSLSQTSVITDSEGRAQTTVTFASGVANVTAIASGGANGIATAFYDPAPVITTDDPSSIATTSVTLGGSVPSSAFTLSAKGVCYATTRNPTVLESCTSAGSSVGSFSSSVTVISGTRYFVRAYATYSGLGTVYGTEKNFTTFSNRPTLSSASMSSITDISALATATIVDQGTSSITAKGFYYGTQHNPHITGNGGTQVTDSSGGLSISKSLTGLTTVTTYYIVPFATNSSGTSYGLETSFTSDSPPTPTPTATATPTNTPTATATPTPTATPATTAIPGEVAGIVLNPQLQPASGVVVYLYRQDTSGANVEPFHRFAATSDVVGVLSTITDSVGRYSFKGVPTGDYRIVPNFTGMTFEPSVVSVSAGASGAAAITITAIPQDLNDTDCTRTSKVTVILAADAKGQRQLEFAKDLIAKFTARARRHRMSNSDRAFLLGRLERASAQLDDAFTALLNTSETLPKLTLECTNRPECTRVDLRSELAAYKLFVNELRRLSLYVARRSRESIDGTDTPENRRITARIRLEHRQAVRAKNDLPRRTISCVE